MLGIGERVGGRRGHRRCEIHRRAIFGDDERMRCSAYGLVGWVGVALVVSSLPGCRGQKTEAPPASVTAESLPRRTVTAVGLVIEDLKPGTGRVCTASDTIEMHFVAMFADGTVYDSSEMRKRTLLVPLSSPSLIRGLKEGIPGLREGGTRRIEIPWMLAYGANGREPVPPKMDLVFEVELVSIK